MLYGTWSAGLGGGLARGARNDFAFAPLYFVAAFALFRGARLERTNRRVAFGLQLVSAAWLAWGTAFFSWDVPLGPPALANVLGWTLYNLYYPLTIAGLVLLAFKPPTLLARLRMGVDALIALAAAATLQWYFIIRLRTVAFWPHAFQSSFGLLFLAELAIVAGAAVLAHRIARPSDARWATALSTGVFTTVVADLVYEYGQLSANPRVAPVGDVILAVAAALVGTAGLSVRPRPMSEEPRETGALKLGYTLLPYLAISLVAALLVAQFFRRDVGGPIAGLVIGGAGLMVLVIARLLMEQREAQHEAAAREAQDARFRSLVQRSADAIVVVSAEGDVRYASPAFGPMVGRAADQVTGERFATFIGDDAARTLLAHPQTAVGARERWRALDHGGPPRLIEATATDLRDDPAVGGIVLNIRDVTERVRLEDELRQAQKLEVVGRLASSIAHDFNNVLTVVLGNAALARTRSSLDSQTEWKAVTQAAERGAALSRQLLSIGRPTAPNWRTLDLAEEARRIARTLRAVLPSSLVVVIDVPEVVVPVVLDDAHVEQVLLNLALNARDAMSGGGTLTLQLRVQPDAGGTPHAALRVIDTGRGMDAATRERAFEPFFTTKALGIGTGLGLSTVRQIVADAGGTVDLQSAPGAGTTVTLWLPLAAAVPQVAPDAPSASPAPGTGHILVVDDESDVRATLYRFLTEIGYRVSEARDGVEALAMLRTRRIDLVLTDLVMPRLTGEELIRAARAEGMHLPMLCMSGTPGVRDAGEPPWDSAHIVAKPLSLQLLATRIADELRRHAH